MLIPIIAVIVFFWLACEVIILNYVSTVWRINFSNTKRSIVVVILFSILLPTLLLLSFWEGWSTLLFRNIYEGYDAVNYKAYLLLVDIYCTAWVLLESAITVYVAFICSATKHVWQDKVSVNDNIYFQKQNKRLIIYLALITAAFVVFFVGYHIVYFEGVSQNKIPFINVYKQIHFYFYICAFLWVLIDFVAAFFAYRFYRILVEHSGKLDELFS